MRDGTFGTTAHCPGLDDDIVRAVEGHEFEALDQLYWRNSELDLSHVDALLQSLTAAPPRPGLVRGPDATDLQTLEAVAREEEVRRVARGRRMVRLLWEACQIPDFRKLADDSHTALCGRIFRHLAEDGRLPDEWVAGQIATLGNVEGDLDTLMARLASIRVWSYVAARADWVGDAARFQNEARAAEDAVSDALHERLTARFVDRRAAHLIRRLDDTEEELLSAVTRQGEVVVEGHPVGHVGGFGRPVRRAVAARRQQHGEDEEHDDVLHDDEVAVGDGVEHGVFGDFVEHDTLRLDVFQAAFGFEDFKKMPGNRFAFPIRVGCEVDVFGFFGSGDNRIDVFGVAFDQLVSHGEVVFGIDGTVFGDEVADVAVGGQNFEIAAKVFFQGFGFGR